MTSVRLSKEIERKLKKASEKEQKNKSEIIKAAISMYLEQYDDNTTIYEKGAEYFGKYGSGKNNLSKDYKKILKKKIDEKRSR